MTEDQNIPEENIENENSKSEEVNENISQEQTIVKSETTNPNPEIQKSEIENMEVHHHPDLHHRKKHWKEYFLEFLMIFLAVFLSFITENLREKSGDRNKEKEYIHSMASDTKSDITDMNRLIKSLTFDMKRHDSLVTMLNEVLSKNDYEFYKKVYYANTVFTWDDPNVAFTESTISELKSSGNLRLIQSKALTDSILKYEETNTNGEDQHDYVKESISKTFFAAQSLSKI
jgi:hypothetical protein